MSKPFKQLTAEQRAGIRSFLRSGSSLNDQIKLACRALGVSDSRLGEATGIKPLRLERIVNNRAVATPQELEKILGALGLDPLIDTADQAPGNSDAIPAVDSCGKA